MKKMITMLAIGAVVTTASADLTGLLWTGGVVTDQVGGAFVTGDAFAHTLLNLDLAPLVVDNAGQLEIDIADIQAVFSIDQLGISPAFLGGVYGMSVPLLGAAVGDVAYLVVKNGAGAIALGDFIGLGANGVLVDLQPDPSLPAGAPQEIAGGDVQTNIVVIPEPATLGMMGVAALGLFLARKKAHR